MPESAPRLSPDFTDPTDRPLVLGAFVFDGLDQLDFTGPFEILSRVPDSTFHIFGKTAEPVRDMRGLVITPQSGLSDVPPLDVLIVPGGQGVNLLMEDEPVLAFLRAQAAGARCVFSICTGALLLGAAGLLVGRRATTHWASHEFLAALGAIPVDARVVVDGPLITAAGVTSGLDGALTVTAALRGPAAAQAIQLYLEYRPDPPFSSGSPTSAPGAVTASVRRHLDPTVRERAAIVRRVAERLVIP